MIIGIDFDNTIVNYGDIFYNEALKRCLLPANTASDRQSVRDALRGQGMDAEFTLLQAHVYGPGILEADPYPHALETISDLLKFGFELYVISHKTRYPYLGPAHDLHEFARTWLQAQGFMASGLLDRAHIFMETSLQSKLERIAKQKCDYFIDDLPEFLLHHDFPQNVRRILFDPCDKNCVKSSMIKRLGSWQEINNFLVGIFNACKR